MATIVEVLADGLVILVAIISLIVLFTKVPRQNRYECYTRIFMAGLTSYALAKLIGDWWRPEAERPFQILGVSPGAAFLNNPGFPSDHALFGAFLTLAVWYGTRNRTLTMILAILTLIMSAARVVALVHTPLDIVGGLVIGLAGGVWYIGHAKTKSHTHVAKRARR